MHKKLPLVIGIILLFVTSVMVFGCATTPPAGEGEQAKIENDDVATDENEDAEDVEEETEEEETDVDQSSYTPGNGPRVVMETTQGRIVMELFPDVAPKTVESFKKLIGQKFYDGLIFHRYVPGFVIQGGDPKGDGTGGPGYTVPAEFSDRRHIRGALAMARSSDPNSAGSQFYIVLDEASARSLDGQYTIFGQVIEGMESVDKLRQGDIMKTLAVEEATQN